MTAYPFPFWQHRPHAPAALRAWLLDRGSLTHRLQQRCRRFEVEVLHQHWQRALPDEAALLGIAPHTHALVREVLLRCDGRAVVFARSILPRTSLLGAWRDLGRIGSRPLGGALFSDPRIRRAPLRFCRCHLRQVPQAAGQGGALWARRSLFSLQGRRILVSECFLPAIHDLAP